MEELKNFNSKKRHQKLQLPDNGNEFVNWIKGLGLLHSKRTYDCGNRMRLRGVREGESYPKWLCAKKKCRKEKGFLVGTPFEGTHLSLKEVFQLSYCYYFVRQTHSQDEIQFELQREDGSTIRKKRLWTGSIFSERLVVGTSAETQSRLVVLERW